MKLEELASLLGCDLEGDGQLEIQGVDSLDRAGPGKITFAVDRKRASEVEKSAASAVILPPGVNAHGKPTLRTKHPQLAFARALQAFHPVLPPQPGVHALASIDPTAHVDPTARIGPYVIIEKNARIGARSAIDAFTFVGQDVSVGDDCRIAEHVGLRARATIGNRVIIHGGASIGSDGFGFTPDEKGGVEKVPQVGTVVIEDDVEIGALTAIDRATVGATRIRKSAKIDNLCQIAHNCDIGEYAILTGQCGLAGSVRIGKGVIMGGGAGVLDGGQIGDGARIASLAGVVGDVPAGEAYGGAPAMPLVTYRRAMIALRKLPDMLQRLRRLERAAGKGAALPEREDPPGEA